MKSIEIVYKSLLTDIESAFSCSFQGTTARLGLDWAVHTAPTLDKELLNHLEHGTPFGESWPEDLIALRDRAIYDPLALRAIRQLLLFCYKADHKYTNEQSEKTLQTWLDTNARVGHFGKLLDEKPPALLRSVKSYVTAVLSRGRWDSVVPFHGPGAVFDKAPKGHWQSWYSTIESLYPYYKFFGISLCNYRDGAEDFVIKDVIECRLTPVPKDARGPRLICVHPAEAVWLQQGLRKEMERVISSHRDDYQGWTSAGHILFDDQSVNGFNALTSSEDKYYATIDLKEASDSLSDKLVQVLFGDHYKYFGCCRASVCVLPDGSKTEVFSYAPMGNATTFPVQALVFWGICVATLDQAGVAHPWRDIFVVGDDIEVRSPYAPLVMEALADFGLTVNTSKSFYKGFFRESCGVDAFKGVDVTPVRWKAAYQVSSVEDLQALSDLAQRLLLAGYLFASREAYSLLRELLWREFGYRLSRTNNPNHGGIAELTECESLVWEDAYWHEPKRKAAISTQQWVTPVWRLETVANATVSGWNHVLTSLVSLERMPKGTIDGGHAISVHDDSSSRRVRLKRGWAPIC